MIDQNDDFKNTTVTFTKKWSLTLKIKFKIRSAIIYEGQNLIDNDANYCTRVFTEFLTNFCGAFSMVLNILTGIQ